MIAQNFEYSAPENLHEALALLAGGNAKVLAGGMSLIPLMKLRLAAPEHVVDLAHVPDLKSIREEGSSIRIGSMATHFEIESSALIRGRCPLLAEAASNIGDVQVRNMGTIGGSIAHADPAADYPASLMALEAQVRLVSSKGERTLSIDQFFTDALSTALEAGEIVRELIVPVEEKGAGVSYRKMVQPASGFAIVGAAARVRRSGGKVSFVRVGITGLAGKAYRAANVEKLLEGTAGSSADIQKAAAVVADGVDANSDLHASADYRRHMAQVYTARALSQAVSRAS
ncbi:MAG TPA: xanthine dehydrogenase family protein subunit M [Bryobacteraceae bacterium]|nr:xanthine dehydrogenase family protein subunit M [Bryobacteraceae bacterium]